MGEVKKDPDWKAPDIINRQEDTIATPESASAGDQPVEQPKRRGRPPKVEQVALTAKERRDARVAKEREDLARLMKQRS